KPSEANYAYLRYCREKLLPEADMTVEFRSNAWLDKDHHVKTISFCRSLSIGIVCIDETVRPSAYSKSSKKPELGNDVPESVYGSFGDGEGLKLPYTNSVHLVQ